MFSKLPNVLKNHIFSFLPNKDLCSVTLVNKEFNISSNLTFKNKIYKEFGIDLPLDFHPMLTYSNLVKERDFFIAFALSFGECLGRQTVNIDFREARTQWVDCIINKKSFDSFLLSFNHTIKTCEVNEKKIIQLKEEIEKEFCSLLNHFSSIEKEYSYTALSMLCGINASCTIKLIGNINTSLMETYYPYLLREAITFLSIETISTLLELGVDIHSFLRHSDHSDDGYQVLGSPLYCTMMLPEEVTSFLARYIKSPYLNWDNEKLLRIMQLLLSKGSNPKQHCVLADKDDMQNTQDTEENCSTLAIKLLERVSNTETHPEYLLFLNTLIDKNIELERENEKNDEIHKSCCSLF